MRTREQKRQEALEAQISTERAEQRKWQAALQDAEQLEVEALSAEQEAIDAQRKAQRLALEARTAVHEHAHRIDELLVMLPFQRGAND